MNNHIVSWNVRGLRKRRIDLNLLLSVNNPIAVCLQETMCQNDNQSSIRGFTTYHRPRINGSRAAGGVMTAIKSDIDSNIIDINTDLEAIAVKVGAPLNANILNVYLPPGSQIKKEEIMELIAQIPEPFILVGDLNAHHPLWGSDEVSTRGKVIESVISEGNLVVLNNGERTYINSATGTGSCIDIGCCTTQLAGILDLTVSEDSHGSDHFPLIISLMSTSQQNEGNPRWKIEEADWGKYQSIIQIAKRDDIIEQIEEITQQIILAAEQSIPKTKGCIAGKSVPWWNDEVASVIKNRRKALRKWKNNKNNELNSQLANEYQEANNKAQKIINEAKNTSWKEFVKKFNVHTPAKEMWNNFRKIQGKYKPSTIREIIYNDQRINTNKEIANSLAEHFGAISSDKSYTQDFMSHKTRIEETPLKIINEEEAEYNKPFTKNELDEATEGLKGSSPGPDNIHYAMITNLPIEYRNLLLDSYNRLWKDSVYPESWTKSIVVPIFKGKGDRNRPGNYRPIYLNSCLGKILERMVNNRLMYIIEERKLINDHQYAFRKGKSTTDYLGHFENIVREAMHKKRLTQAVFLDIKKAYDTTWRRLVLNRMSQWKIGGNLIKYIQQMLGKRTFRVKANGTLSSETLMENGLCQGSVISVTLFLIAIDTICSNLPPGIQVLLFADDVALISSDGNLKKLAKRLQAALKAIETWQTLTGFKISTEKCATVIFKNPRSRKQPYVNLKLNNDVIPNKKAHKCLGITLDQHLTFKTHIEEIKAACNQRTQFLRCVAHRSWGGDQQTITKIYKSTVLEKMLYAAPIISSASDSTIKMLESIHNQGLRIITGAFRTSPVESLQVESGIPSLRSLLNQRLLIYATKFRSNNLNQETTETDDHNSDSSGELWNQDQITEPINIEVRSRNILESLGTSLPPSKVLTTPKTPPWVRKSILIDKTMLSASRNGKSQIELRKLFAQRIHTKYRTCRPIYTDGSKNETKTGFSVITEEEIIRRRTHSQLSIYCVESLAIIEALKWIANQDRVGAYVICTDSLSVISSLEKKKIKTSLKDEIIYLYNEIAKNGTSVTFLWVPSHIGIPGNEQADKEAKRALEINTIMQKVVDHREIKTIIKARMIHQWNNEWNVSYNNKLREIKNTVAPFREARTGNRREDVILTRLRIGHTQLTHSYLLEKADPPKCTKCNQALTVKHIIVNCPGYNDTREKIGLEPSMREALADDGSQAEKVLQFFKEIGLIDAI